MTRITRDDVTRAVGQADDVTIAKIIATGATAEELAEAQAWIANDEPLINAGKPLAKGRVGELVDILTELDASEEDEGCGGISSSPPNANHQSLGAYFRRRRGAIPPRIAERALSSSVSSTSASGSAPRTARSRRSSAPCR